MLLGAVVHESSFETRFHLGDHRLVDIAFLFAADGRFNIQIQEFLAIYDCNPKFFRVGCIE